MNNTIVNIAHENEDRFYAVERIFREYQASQELLAFVMSKSDINDELLNKYIDRAEYRNVELSLKRDSLGKELAPVELQGKTYNYMYDFDNQSIVYTWEE